MISRLKIGLIAKSDPRKVVMNKKSRMDIKISTKFQISDLLAWKVKTFLRDLWLMLNLKRRLINNNYECARINTTQDRCRQ